MNRSLALGEPVIYVSANYRLNGMHVFDTKRHRLIHILAFGFLAGKEVKDRGLTNVGLHDRKPLDSPALLTDWRMSLQNDLLYSGFNETLLLLAVIQAKLQCQTNFNFTSVILILTSY